MAIDKIEINTEALNRDIEVLEEKLANTNADIKDLYNNISELNTMWKGSANNAFNTQFNNDMNIMLEISSTLKEYIKSLKDARKTYVSCENSVNDTVKSLDI